jgi:hypothetical protein
MNGPKKLDCYISLVWKGLPGKNALGYWTQSLVARKMNKTPFAEWENDFVVKNLLLKMKMSGAATFR